MCGCFGAGVLEKFGETPKLVAMLQECWSGVVVAASVLVAHGGWTLGPWATPTGSPGPSSCLSTADHMTYTPKLLRYA